MTKRPEPLDPRSGLSPERSRRAEPSSWLAQAGLLTAIPFVLLVGPVLGYYLGTALDRRWPWDPWGVVLGIVLGFVASARVTMQFIRQAKRLHRHE